MLGREKLKLYWGGAECVPDDVYEKEEVDKVMDAMERRIARLFNLVAGYQRNSLGLSAMYKRRLDSELERITELESQLPSWKVLNSHTPKNKYLKFLSIKKDGKPKVNAGFVREGTFGVDVVLFNGASAVSKSFKELEGKIFYLEVTLPSPPTTEEK